VNVLDIINEIDPEIVQCPLCERQRHLSQMTIDLIDGHTPLLCSDRIQCNLVTEKLLRDERKENQRRPYARNENQGPS